MTGRLRVLMMLVGVCLATGQAEAQETTWTSPPVSTQVDRDETIVPVGKGAVFCPSMTDPENEPAYGVIDENGRQVADAKTGSRIPLAPGLYTVLVGSGTRDQMIKKRVRVEEGATTVIKPDWCGLVIDVITESRTPVREYYELFNLDTGASCGIGQGAEEGLDERIITWLLPPGRYKVVKAGENINAVINFGTIRLLPGELAHANLVVDRNTTAFLGFGYLSDIRQLEQRSRRWRTLSELSGNALLNYSPSSATGTESDANFTSTLQLLSDARYESGNHVIPFWMNIEEGLSMDEDRVLRKYVDKAEMRFTYIYRLTDLVSPYIRASAETRFFPTNHRFENPSDFVELGARGDTLRVVRGAETIRLARGFAPAYLKQGFGITSVIVKTIPVNINLRGGYGIRSTIPGGAALFNTNTNTLTKVLKTDTTGMESLLLADVRLGRHVILNSEFDILMPSTDNDRWIFDGENRLRISLTGAISLMITMEYWRDENVGHTQYRYQTLLRFSTYL